MYIELKENEHGFTHLDVDITYNKGGINYFTYRNEPRGYYAGVTPVEKNNNMVSFTAFTGVKKFIEPAKRLSRKTLAALNADAVDICDDLIKSVCAKYNLQIEGR